MSSSYPTFQGRPLLLALIQTIETNGTYLSEIDGATGDGDHGINMTKGFRRTRELLGDREVTVAEGLEILGNVLLAEIGGAMGPLYGTFFLEMAAPCRGLDAIDRDVFGKMLAAALATVQNLGGAKPGDKTMIDALVPAVSEYQTVVIGGADFPEALIRMAAAAEKGRDSTRDMIAKLGRASRLGERSRGILDAGAASCALILKSLAHSLNG